ncbi:hypothetical protein GGS23DRAFT_101037 [Durotheca rogersii]|uniref:uncharacterized protein n=1 Tax=Durotheca rogersii TaxID=419775 RepID=UPI0022202A52|nr:uncharacterized protein GGS23DRAFT_101037 [Durotheca rogersii]KAI5862453.1 hypothetical protein GGS23DRAFT_101037 [Durotheca rogersii]
MHDLLPPRRQNTPQSLLLFCHEVPNYTFLLANGNWKKLGKAIEPGSRLTRVSTAGYSRGWVTSEINHTSCWFTNVAMLTAPNNISNACFFIWVCFSRHTNIDFEYAPQLYYRRFKRPR